MAGWNFDEALVVMGWFLAMKGVLEGAVNPSLASVVEHIRKGTLDFVLLKPADAQFLVSTAKFAPWRVVDVAAGVGVIAWAFHRLGRWPGGGRTVAAALLLTVCAVAVLYSLWILVVSAAFFVVKVDNLSFLFLSIFDAARWPVSVFTGFWRFLFTVVIPLALMTTFPAEALLGRIRPVGGAGWRWPGRSPSWPPRGWFGCGPSRGIPRPRPDRPPCSASPSSAPRVPCPPPPATCRGSRCATGGSTTSSTAARARSGR